jgi:uncharacterized membrane protein
MWGFWFPPFGFFFVLLGVFVLFGILRLILFRRYGPWGWGGGGPGPWRHGWYDHGAYDAEPVLRRRLASGEITEAEYQRLKEVLSK